MTREEKIVEILNKKSKVKVNVLAKSLDVSKVTIRKDLNKLEKRGILQREHGYAVINNENDLNYRLTKNYNIKSKIAKKAAEIVNNGETVIIESGSTCALLAEELAFNKKNITIITNSNFIASYIRKAKDVKIILLGGVYQKDSQVNVGPLTQQDAKTFHVDKLFIGIDGFDKKSGFTGMDLIRSQTAQYLSESADNTIILTDSSKFKRNTVITAFEVEEISKIFTDENITEDIKEFLESKNIEVVLTDEK
jgi:DeoR/GlpR family transcriptional regulator of sugar metabolism